jgi:hypothetical protein
MLTVTMSLDYVIQMRWLPIVESTKQNSGALIADGFGRTTAQLRPNIPLR